MRHQPKERSCRWRRAGACLLSAVGSLAALGLGPAAGANEILDAHNAFRARAGVAPLLWSEELAEEARQWAEHLARTLTFEHSGLPGAGENLALVPLPCRHLSRVVALWGQEQTHYRPGVFPAVSRTGNWLDIGHYSQIIWRRTTHVGCGGSADRIGTLRFVCRYRPAGNRMGEPVE